MKAKKFDSDFDSGKDITGALDLSKARRPLQELGQLGKLVEGEGEIVVTRRGKPVARLLPVKGALKRPDHAELRSEMPVLDIASEELIRMDRDER